MKKLLFHMVAPPRLLLFTVCKFLIVKDAVDEIFLLSIAVLFSL